MKKTWIYFILLYNVLFKITKYQLLETLADGRLELQPIKR